MKTRISKLAAFLLLFAGALQSAHAKQLVVDAAGTGDFTSIQAAIESIPFPNLEEVTIEIKNGVYAEKLRIDNDNIRLVGEDRNKTVVEFTQLKNDWQANKDYTGPAIVNISGDDITLENITFRNVTPKVGPTAYVLYGTGTRTVVRNCNLLGNGANTVSLMNYKRGMYFLEDCRIEGTVDCMRAMGWCFIERCEIYQKEAISSLWHAVIGNPSQKMVVKDCRFDGVEHYFLGRHHWDAQIFIVNCQFTDQLADLAIYRKTFPENPAKEKPHVFGDRHYYLGNQQEGTNYSWMKDNVADYNPQLKVANFNAHFTFDGKWDPAE